MTQEEEQALRSELTEKQTIIDNLNVVIDMLEQELKGGNSGN